MSATASRKGERPKTSKRAFRPLAAMFRGLTRPHVLRAWSWSIVYLAAVLAIAHGSLYIQGLLLVAAVFGVLALSQDMSTGLLGLYSLGQAGLFAIGAYLTAVLAARYQTNSLLLLVLTVVVCGIVGAFLGALSLRVSGLYFAITTLIFTIVVSTVIEQLGITGGYSGLEGPNSPSFPAAIGNVLGSAQAWITMAVLAVALILTVGVRKSPLYVALLAVRDTDATAEAAGVPTRRTKVWVLSLSAALAGAAGWAFSFLGFISPGQFTWSVSVNILIMVLLGGVNSVAGPLIGAAFISIFPSYVNISGLMQEVLFGGILLLVVIVSPEGVLGVLRRGAGRLATFRSGHMPDTPEIPLVAARSRVASTPPDRTNDGVAGGWQEMPATTRVDSTSGRRGNEGVAIACRGVKYRYRAGRLYALGGVDVEVPSGEIHALIGANGSGKSTLVDIIAGRRTPEAGRILIRGRDVTGLPAKSRPGLGVMRTFQHAQFVDELTLTDNVLLGLYHHIGLVALRGFVWPLLPGSHREMAELRGEARRCLEQVGLGGWTERRAADVPHGVIQLMQLALIIAVGADIVLLDEPLAGLSSSEVEMVVELVRDLQRQGKTIVLIEHQISVVAKLADSVTVLDAGSVVIKGPAGATLRSREVREVYLGAAT